MTNGETTASNPTGAEEDQPAKRPKGQPGTGPVLLVLGVPLLAGIIGYSIAADSFWSIASVSLVVAAGSFALGGFLGFLFGVPKGSGSVDDESPEATVGPLAPNTNLVQISDWFTKILIGATLVQFTELVDSIGRFSTDTLAPALGDDQAAKAYAIALLVGAFVMGFLVGYLFTRLILQVMMGAADREAFVDQVAKRVAKSTELADKVAKKVEPAVVDEAAKTAERVAKQ